MSSFKVGDEVVCILNGEGTVVDTNWSDDYPIEVVFYNNEETYNEQYTLDGKMSTNHIRPSLYCKGTKIIIDIPKYEVGKFYLLECGNRQEYVRCVSEDGVFSVSPNNKFKLQENWTVKEIENV